MQANRQHGLFAAPSAGGTLPQGDPCVDKFLAAGTEESFSPVCQLLSPQLMKYFRLRNCDSAAAEELTQDVLFAVFRYAGSIRDNSLFRGWVYKIAKNALLQRWRTSRRRIDLFELDSMGPHPPESSVPCGADGSDFAGIVAVLGPEEREILTLRFVEGLDYREISAALDIPVGTAKWRVFNSKLKLSMQLRRRTT